MRSSIFDTPLGPMLAVGDDQFLHFLGFFNEKKIRFVNGITEPIQRIRQELKAYFSGDLKTFQTPICIEGSPFQKQVWMQLQNIPFGKTKSYKEVAGSIQNPLACRAVGHANSANQFIILIPCHRVIQADGSLGGYSAGLERKKWLLNHEGSTHG